MDALQAHLLELKKSYTRRLPEKIACIETAFTGFFASAWEERACSESHRLIHSLTGSSGTFGYPDICRVARRAEDILKASLDSRTPPGVNQQQEALRLCTRLKELADEAFRTL